MYKASLTMAILGTFSMSLIAAKPVNQGHGKVNFIGEIVNSPCSINPESIDQTVDLGQIANVSLKDGGTSSARTFTIQLEDCDFSEQSASTAPIGAGIKLTFTGSEAAFGNLLGVTGFEHSEATKGQNVGIQINDANNSQVFMGTPIDLKNSLQEGSNTLLFTSYLRGKAASKLSDIPLGNFYGVTNFTIDYQ
jgi:type 1 fimbria pilin